MTIFACVINKYEDPLPTVQIVDEDGEAQIVHDTNTFNSLRHSFPLLLLKEQRRFSSSES